VTFFKNCVPVYCFHSFLPKFYHCEHQSHPLFLLEEEPHTPLHKNIKVNNTAEQTSETTQATLKWRYCCYKGSRDHWQCCLQSETIHNNVFQWPLMMLQSEFVKETITLTPSQRCKSSKQQLKTTESISPCFRVPDFENHTGTLDIWLLNKIKSLGFFTSMSLFQTISNHTKEVDAKQGVIMN